VAVVEKPLRAQGLESGVCRREGCGHHRHSHSRRGPCTVKRVSGPPSEGNVSLPVREDATDAQLHPGRTVTRCGCLGYLA
jgi:hypothetical protein